VIFGPGGREAHIDWRISGMKGKGRVIIHTGDGKGKTTAAFGSALRAVGHGKSVLIVQFVKARTDVGEVKAAGRLAPELTVLTLGSGFLRGGKADKTARAKAKRAARKALEEARRGLRGAYELVILDEIFAAVELKLISARDVAGIVKGRASGVHVLLTGRNAPKSVLKLADTATEMKLVAHAHDRGTPAEEGIEF